MAYTYSPRYRKPKRIKAVFIGKKFLLSTAFFLMLITSFSVAVVIININTLPLKLTLDRYIVENTITVIGAGVNNKPFWELEKSLGTFFGINDMKDNFLAVPVFYNVKTEMKEPPVLKASSAVISRYIPKNNITERNVATGSLKIKNETIYTLDIPSLEKAPLDFELNSKNPEILIVHTHGSESYTQSPKYNYSDSDYSRCQDLRYNVVRVGEELSKELKKKGFNVIHDRTINDYPSYNNSYNKTLDVIERNIEKYPSIKCVFDIHRDAIVDENENKIKFTADINGEKVSQVMIVCGSDQLGLSNPNWQKNLSFALKIQNCLNREYPGLMRPLNLRKERFNMHKTTGSLIFEIGTHGNTLDEALASIKYLAEGIEKVLK